MQVSEVASINPRSDSIAPTEQISFVGMAQLDAQSAVATPLDSRSFSSVSKGYTIFNNHDILAAKITPCWENGKIGEASLTHPIGVGSTEFHVIRHGKSIDRRYLLHFLRRPEIRTAGQLRMTGSGGQRRVPASFIKELRIPLPPLDEQRRIAAILDQADAIRAKRHQTLNHLESLPAAIFLKNFHEDSHDEYTPLSNLADIASGITKGRRTSDPTRPVPYLAVYNVQAGHLKMDFVKTINATTEEIDRYSLHSGDLVLTEGGDPDKLGRGTVWRDELPLCLHQNHIFRVRVRPDIPLHSDFLSAFMASSTARKYFLRAAKQTTGIASINMRQLRALPVRLPPITLQKLFVDELNKINAQRSRVKAALARDDELFASLQSRAFKGEL
ncbi:restriction endonuclease subunit S [Propionibacterium freudenreichii]|uniref:restriction endonuclease subunit S n=2 Tax=Propionibacterium freudenreichii TaxID=1744 RepID=UPI00254E6E77|nr:restriction endonuclease subunit S [Propionibacterium freudenreichii]MDK9352911.1 restriction endonuclease subunit S [Propionibacterium freudenreichii]